MSNQLSNYKVLELNVKNLDCILQFGGVNYLNNEDRVLTYIDVTGTKLVGKSIDELDDIMPESPRPFSYACHGVTLDPTDTIKQKCDRYFIGYDNFGELNDGKYGFAKLTKDDAVQCLYDTVAEIYKALVFLDIKGE